MYLFVPMTHAILKLFECELAVLVGVALNKRRFVALCQASSVTCAVASFRLTMCKIHIGGTSETIP